MKKKSLQEKGRVSSLTGPTPLAAAVRRALLCAGIAGSMSAANAQTTPAPTVAGSTTDEALSEIVVTGTLIRGVTPVGIEPTTVTREDIVATGVTSTQDLLATMPSITSSFNQVQNPRLDAGRETVTTAIHGPTNGSGIGAANGSPTLVLFDGHDVIGSGTTQTTPDVGVIPPNMIERVEVISDGGSALYGADALTGIVNFKLRKKMEGVEIDAHAGYASPYHNVDANIAGGHEWSDGSFIAAYSYRTNGDLTGAERPYFTQYLVPFGGTDRRSGQCPAATITDASGVNYQGPSYVATTNTHCDADLTADLFPAETQHSFYADFTQDFGSRVSFDINGFYTNRQTTRVGGNLLSGSGTITTANPYFIAPPGTGLTSETVTFGYGSNTAVYKTKEGEITPSVKVQIGGDWELTALLNAGRSWNTLHAPTPSPIAQTLLNGTTATTALDPFDIGTNSPQLLSSLTNWELYEASTQTLYQTKVSATGSIFSLPAGNVKLAGGVQWEEQRYVGEDGQNTIGDTTGAVRDVNALISHSAFGELYIPILKDVPGAQELTFDAQGRYDSYNNGVGKTTNPKIGLTYKPTSDFTLRGTWGTSFTAPSQGDLTGSVDSQLQIFGSSWLAPTNVTKAEAARPMVIVAGGGSVKPQTSTNWTVGVDFQPDFLDKTLTLSLTNWNEVIKGIINIFPIFNGQYFYNNYPNQVIFNPTPAQAQAFLKAVGAANDFTGTCAGVVGGCGQGAAGVLGMYNNPATVPYEIFNALRTNLGNFYLDGLDFKAAYKKPVNFGVIFATVQGTYLLSETQSNAGSSVRQQYIVPGNNVSRLLFMTNVGAVIGPWTAGVTVNYSSSFPVNTSTGQPTYLRAFDPVNLNAAYDFGQVGSVKDIMVTLNVNNAFNITPEQTYNGLAGNGSTVGRFTQLGVHAKF